MTMPWLEEYLSYLTHEKNYSPHTVHAYGEDVASYLRHAADFLGQELEPSSADTDLVRAWLGDMMNRGIKPSSVERRLAAVKSYYRYLLRMKRIDKHPIAHLRAPIKEKPLPVYVPTKEVERILSATAEGDDFTSRLHHLIIATLYECGLRRSELAGIRDEDVDLTRRQLKVLGKGGKERIVPFGRGLAEEMQRWLELRNKTVGKSEYFFLTLKGKKVSTAAIYTIVRAQLESVPTLERRGPHALRHSFATDMLNNGADLVAIKELMGHSSISTTVKYTHLTFKQLQDMYNAHPRAKKKE